RHAPSADPSQVPHLRFPELAVARLAALDRANRGRDALRPAPLQIGVGRVAMAEKAGGAGIHLQWRAVPGGQVATFAVTSPVAMAERAGGAGIHLQWRAVPGGQVATFAVTSPVAMGLRVGLALQGLPANAELRIRGSELPLGDIVLVPATEALAAGRDGGLYWTPATDGETQTVEIFAPAGADVAALRVAAPELSHLVSNSRRDFRIIEKIGESGSCNIDTACRVDALGTGFAVAKDAVAHMLFNLYE